MINKKMNLTILYAAAIVVLTATVYLPSLGAPFVFDDLNHIVQNPRIKHIFPLEKILANTNRPVVDLTLAANYALGKVHVTGYHLVNLAIHLFAAIILFLIFRATLEKMSKSSTPNQRFSILAWFSAILWAVHPLQTESVTYTIQRSESLMGLFYLLTLYAVIRSIPHKNVRWGIAAIIFCWLGMATKEVMVTAPIIVLFYDRIYLAKNFREIFRRRGWIYGGMALSWILLFYLTNISRSNATNAGASLPGVSPFTYALVQQKVITRYLQLALWPTNLCFDYSWGLPKNMADILPFGIFILILLGSAIVLLIKKPFLGFWAVWFFLILAPTSSFLPIGDLIVEHRMYLPLAAITFLFVWLVQLISTRLSWLKRKNLWVNIFSGGVISVLMLLTFQRNLVYQNPETLWRDVLKKANETERVHINLGSALLQKGNIEEAKNHFHRALELSPNDGKIYFNLGLIAIRQDHLTEAEKYFTRGFELLPNFQGVDNIIGMTYFEQGLYERAGYYLKKAVHADPQNLAARFNLAMSLANSGKLAEAEQELTVVVGTAPNFPDAANRLTIIRDILKKN